jgi:hypothetical protein
VRRPKQSQALKIAHEPHLFKQTGFLKAIEMANKITLNQGLVKRYCAGPIPAPVAA